MARWHLLIDFETWDDKAYKAAPIDMAACIFDWERFTTATPYSCLEIFKSIKHFKISLNDLMTNYPKQFTISTETNKFWLQQSKEVRERIKPRQDDLTLDEFTSEVLNLLDSVDKFEGWWTRGNAFDPVILERLFDNEGSLWDLKQRIPHYKVNDVRTWIRSFSGFDTKTDFIPIEDEAFFSQIMKPHDCRFDVMADVMRLQTLARINADLGVTNR